MRRSKYFKVVISVVLIAFVLQIGLMAYSMINNEGGNNPVNIVQKIFNSSKLLAVNTVQESTSTANITEFPTINDIVTKESTVTTEPAAIIEEQAENIAITIPQDILDLIKASDPAAYEKNAANYKELLLKLNVHEKYQTEIEKMIKAGKQLPDVLIAYSFVNDSFGTIGEVKNLVDARASGKGWPALFEDYIKNNPAFAPQSFDSFYLEELLKTDGITKDDIMIADRVSQKTSIPFTDVMKKRIGKQTWREINAEYGVVNGQAELPRVFVEPEKVKILMQSSGLSEQKIVQAYVTAFKLDSSVETIIKKVKSGYSKARIYSECLVSKFE
jgi:hypothetical protein